MLTCWTRVIDTRLLLCVCRDEIALRLPPVVQELRRKSPWCPFLHGSTLGKRMLYLGDSCCVHEAFMSCATAESVVMVAERRGEGNEDEGEGSQRGLAMKGKSLEVSQLGPQKSSGDTLSSWHPLTLL